jgi:hypothetical protein
MANKSHSQLLDDAIKANNESYDAGRKSVINEVKEAELKLGAAKWVYEMAGKVKASHFAHRQAEFLTLLMLKQIKETRDYRLTYGMTWEEFCDYVHLDRRTVDRHLEDLEPFRVDFLVSFANFAGADISKIKYLGRAISDKMTDFDGHNIIIDGEKIPCIPERADEIGAVLDRLREELKAQNEELAAQKKASDRIQSDLHKRINKLEKDDARRKGVLADRDLSADEATFMKEMEALRLAFDGLLINADPGNIEALALDRDPSPRIRAAMVSTAYYMRMQILKYYDVVEQTYGDAIMNPEQSPFAAPGFMLKKDPTEGKPN